MDKDESRAKLWLQSQGYTDIKYVENTNCQPPDFIIDNSIAVEVRRLNQMYGDKNEGLENIELPLWRSVSSGLATANQPPPGHKVYVIFELHHTEKQDKKLIVSELQRATNDYIKHIKNSPDHEYNSPPNARVKMTIHFICTESACNHFKLASVHADPKARLVVENSIDNINRCILEKSDKIKDKHDLYTEWWLVLMEHNVFPTALRDPGELQTLKNGLTDTTPWTQIVIVSSIGLPSVCLT